MSTQDKLADALREMTSFAHHMKHPPFGTIANADAALEAHDSDAAGGKGVPEGLRDFLSAKMHHLPVEDQHVLSVFLAAAPSPQETK